MSIPTSLNPLLLFKDGQQPITAGMAGVNNEFLASLYGPELKAMPDRDVNMLAVFEYGVKVTVAAYRNLDGAGARPKFFGTFYRELDWRQRTKNLNLNHSTPPLHIQNVIAILHPSDYHDMHWSDWAPIDLLLEHHLLSLVNNIRNPDGFSWKLSYDTVAKDVWAFLCEHATEREVAKANLPDLFTDGGGYQTLAATQDLASSR